MFSQVDSDQLSVTYLERNVIHWNGIHMPLLMIGNQFHD